MGGRKRRRWFALLVPVALLAVLAGGGGPSGASGGSVPGGNVALTFTASPLRFAVGDVHQNLTLSGCDVTGFTGTELVTLTPSKPADPQGAIVGFFGGGLGVKGVTDTGGAAGRPCGETDNFESLGIALGPALAQKTATGGSITVIRQPGNSNAVTVKITFLDRSGKALGIQTFRTGNSTSVTRSLEPPSGGFEAIELTSLTSGKGFGLSAMTLNLKDGFAEIIDDCKVVDDPIALEPLIGPIGVGIEIIASKKKDDGPEDCVLPYNLEAKVGTAQNPLRTVLFEFPDNGWTLTFRWATTWDPEPSAFPVPATRISLDGGLTSTPLGPCPAPGVPPATGVRWCLDSQSAAVVEPGQMQVSDVVYGIDDPIKLR